MTRTTEERIDSAEHRLNQLRGVTLESHRAITELRIVCYGAVVFALLGLIF